MKHIDNVNDDMAVFHSFEKPCPEIVSDDFAGLDEINNFKPKIMETMTSKSSPFIFTIKNLTDVKLVDVKLVDPEYEKDNKVSYVYDIPGLTYKNFIHYCQRTSPPTNVKISRIVMDTKCGEEQLKNRLIFKREENCTDFIEFKESSILDSDSVEAIFNKNDRESYPLNDKFCVALEFLLPNAEVLILIYPCTEEELREEKIDLTKDSIIISIKNCTDDKHYNIPVIPTEKKEYPIKYNLLFPKITPDKCTDAAVVFSEHSDIVEYNKFVKLKQLLKEQKDVKIKFITLLATGDYHKFVRKQLHLFATITTKLSEESIVQQTIFFTIDPYQQQGTMVVCKLKNPFPINDTTTIIMEKLMPEVEVEFQFTSTISNNLCLEE